MSGARPLRPGPMHPSVRVISCPRAIRSDTGRRQPMWHLDSTRRECSGWLQGVDHRQVPRGTGTVHLCSRAAKY